MPGVFDRAEPDGCSHFAFAGVAFRTLEQRRHSDFRPLSRLHTLPACSPVNASRAALRLPAHDSGPGWLATPYLYDSCIRDFTPVYPGALQNGVQLARFGLAKIGVKWCRINGELESLTVATLLR